MNQFILLFNNKNNKVNLNFNKQSTKIIAKRKYSNTITNKYLTKNKIKNLIETILITTIKIILKII